MLTEKPTPQEAAASLGEFMVGFIETLQAEMPEANYIVFGMKRKDADRQYEIIVREAGMRTPHEMRIKAESERDELLEALEAILPWVPKTTASEGGASKYSEHVIAADKVRAAIANVRGTVTVLDETEDPRVMMQILDQLEHGENIKK